MKDDLETSFQSVVLQTYELVNYAVGSHSNFEFVGQLVLELNIMILSQVISSLPMPE